MENHCNPSSSLETEAERRERIRRVRAEAGRKGGLVKHPKTRWFALHPELAKKCSEKGVEARKLKRKEKRDGGK